MDMDGEKRRAEILNILGTAVKPVSASKLATQFSVSRQIIVGDIALLRASGQQIVATARGYLIESNQEGVIAKIVCLHRPDQTEEELTCIVELGGEVLDVIVAHPIYGELTGNLRIANKESVQRFIEAYREGQAALLSELTGGIHLHTIRCENQRVLASIKDALRQKGILYHG